MSPPIGRPGDIFEILIFFKYKKEKTAVGDGGVRKPMGRGNVERPYHFSLLVCTNPIHLSKIFLSDLPILEIRTNNFSL